jgi:phosphoglycerate kinase
MKFLDQIEISGKKLLVRVDYNVPLKNGAIVDDHRIRTSLPTINYALENKAAVILCSHMGRPAGKRVAELSLAPAAKRLAELLSHQVIMAPDCIGPEVSDLARTLAPGQILMLENLRYYDAEEKNDPAFSNTLAKLADIYVNDAFAVAHRAHASIAGVTRYSGLCCGGLLLKKEWMFLGEALQDPKRPYIAVSGGAKISTKLDILTRLLDQADEMIIGGAMANTFMVAKGLGMGQSLVETDCIEAARRLMVEAEKKRVRIHLPLDFVLGENKDAVVSLGLCDVHQVPEKAMALDIGPNTVTSFQRQLQKAQTVMWNGPMGAFENPLFADGSIAVAKIIASLTGALTIVGGGDTNVVITSQNLADKFGFISTGGGSFMAFMEGRELPAFNALKENEKR